MCGTQIEIFLLHSLTNLRDGDKRVELQKKEREREREKNDDVLRIKYSIDDVVVIDDDG